MLSNGNIHYLWDIENGNPEQIYAFTTEQSLIQYKTFNPEPYKIVKEEVNDDYIVVTQLPNYKAIPEYNDAQKRKELIRNLVCAFYVIIK